MTKLLSSLALLIAMAGPVLPARAQQGPTAPASQPVTSVRDGERDFDFEIGTWTTRVRVLRNPLSGETPNWAEYQGTSVVRPLLRARANFVELSVEGRAGRIEGGSLRLYNPHSRQWSLNFASLRDGMLTAPVYGSFDERGRGRFFGQDMLDGRAILVRFLVTRVSRTEARFEQAYSADGGATWEPNWFAVDTLVDTLVAPAAAFAAPPAVPESPRPADDLARALDAYHRATVRSDTSALAALVTDDYRLVNSDATVQDKSSYLADFAVPGFRIEPYAIEDPFSWIHANTALTGGTFRLRWTQDGRRLSRRLHAAHYWVLSRGRWRIAYTQLTRVPG